MSALEKMTFNQQDVDLRCEAHARLLAGKPNGFLADFRGASLDGLSFVGKDLSESLFSGASLIGCNFSNSNLSDSDFSGALLSEANLSGSNLSRSDFRGSDLTRATLIASDCTETDFRELTQTPDLAIIAPEDGEEDDKIVLQKLQKMKSNVLVTKLDGANFSGSKMAHCRLVAVSAIEAIFDDGNLIHSKLNRARLEKARFCNSMINSTDFSGANLEDADLRGSPDESAIFDQAQTKGMMTGPAPDPVPEPETAEILHVRDMEKRISKHEKLCRGNGGDGVPAIFEGLDFRVLNELSGRSLTALQASKANLSGMNLEGTELQGANLRGADLRGTNLRGADLRGADLSGAFLTHADLRQCRLDPLVLTSERLIPVSLEGVVSRYADFRGADLTQANIKDADLSYSKLGDAKLNGVDLDTAKTDGVSGP